MLLSRLAGSRFASPRCSHRSAGPHVARSVYHSAIVCYEQQCTGAGRCSLLVAAARIVRRSVIGLRIVQCSVSIGRPARSSANRRSSRILAGARCRSPRLAAQPSLLFRAQTLPQQKKGNSADVHAGQRKYCRLYPQKLLSNPRRDVPSTGPRPAA
jgi:hypothetical protein